MSTSALYLERTAVRIGYWRRGKWITQQGERKSEVIWKDLLAVGQEWEVLLAPEVSYFKILEENWQNRAGVAEMVPKLIPEVMQNEQWDWKKIEGKQTQCLLEAVEGEAWQWLQEGKKQGLVWKEITTAKYLAFEKNGEIGGVDELMQAMLAKAELRGKDEKVLNIATASDKKRNYGGWIILSVLLLGGLGLGLGYMTQGGQTPEPVKPISTVTVKPSMSPVLGPSDYNVRVENGAGITGYAAEYAGKLTVAGFANVEIANASQVAEVTLVRSKGELPVDIRKSLEEILAEKISEYQTDLSPDAAVDILIVLAK